MSRGNPRVQRLIWPGGTPARRGYKGLAGGCPCEEILEPCIRRRLCHAATHRRYLVRELYGVSAIHKTAFPPCTELHLRRLCHARLDRACRNLPGGHRRDRTQKRRAFVRAHSLQCAKRFKRTRICRGGDPHEDIKTYKKIDEGRPGEEAHGRKV